MSDMERYYKLVKKFLETYKMDGICKFMVDWSPEDDAPTIDRKSTRLNSSH